MRLIFLNVVRFIYLKTKIAYLNQPIDINELFWRIPITEYYYAMNGVIKKQMKITTFSKEETDNIELKLSDINNYKQI